MSGERDDEVCSDCCRLDFLAALSQTGAQRPVRTLRPAAPDFRVSVGKAKARNSSRVKGGSVSGEMAFLQSSSNNVLKAVEDGISQIVRKE